MPRRARASPSSRPKLLCAIGSWEGPFRGLFRFIGCNATIDYEGSLQLRVTTSEVLVRPCQPALGEDRRRRCGPVAQPLAGARGAAITVTSVRCGPDAMCPTPSSVPEQRPKSIDGPIGGVPQRNARVASGLEAHHDREPLCGDLVGARALDLARVLACRERVVLVSTIWIVQPSR